MGKTTVKVDPADAVLVASPGGPLPGEMLQPMPEPEGGWPADEFTGKGGSYVRDPFTGVRSPAPVVADEAAQ